jgi:hypothetical protein
LIDTLRAVNGLPSSDLVSVGRQLDEIRRLIAPLRKLRWDYARRHSPNQFWYIDQTPPGDFDGLLRVARLSSHGLDWVRRCAGPNCEKWFVAQKGNNFFCSDACRENAWSERRKTPEGRAERAKYMREHRGTLKQRAQRRKQQDSAKSPDRGSQKRRIASAKSGANSGACSRTDLARLTPTTT